MYLLDTNICIYALKGKYPSVAQKLLSIHPNDIKVSAVTVMELEYGVAKSKWSEQSRKSMHAFLASFDILPFTEADAGICGMLRAKLAALGTPIGAYDIMIASQGISRGMTVVTHNVSEFERVPGIILEDWVSRTHF